jgi:nitrous oxide reductase accessory protein NosL
MKRLLLLVLATTGLLVGCSTTSNETAAKPYKLDTCIVSGDKLGEMGPPVVKVYNGQEIKFCCKNCVKDFEKEPAKYLTKLDTK